MRLSWTLCWVHLQFYWINLFLGDMTIDSIRHLLCLSSWSSVIWLKTWLFTFHTPFFTSHTCTNEFTKFITSTRSLQASRRFTRTHLSIWLALRSQQPLVHLYWAVACTCRATLRGASGASPKPFKDIVVTISPGTHIDFCTWHLMARSTLFTTQRI